MWTLLFAASVAVSLGLAAAALALQAREERAEQ